MTTPGEALAGASAGTGLRAVRCMLIRGGTSRGAYFLAADLPTEPAWRDRILLAAMGSPHPLQVDGIGGGNPLTSKVAIVGRASAPGADVDYLFAQVAVDRARVDTRATCGNLLAGVGPFAVEAGLIECTSPETRVRIRSVNSGFLTVATLSTPGGRLRYDGEQAISGVAEPAAPVRLSFQDAAGSLTGALLPTGRPRETIDGVEVSLVDYAIPVMIVGAVALGLRGDEAAQTLDGNPALWNQVEAMRLEAGRRMGLGDVGQSVTPKVALVSRPRAGGTLTSRYLTPWRCHTSHAVTGALCLAAAGRIEGSVVADLAVPGPTQCIEHPSGMLEVGCEGEGSRTVATVVRTARLLFAGAVHVPQRVGFDPSSVAGGHGLG